MLAITLMIKTNDFLQPHLPISFYLNLWIKYCKTAGKTIDGTIAPFKEWTTKVVDGEK